LKKEWVHSSQAVNQCYYIEVLTKLRESVRRKRPELWRNEWIFHQDKAPAHNTLSVKQLLANKNITVLENPPYSPDLAPCNFYLFPKIKSVLKGTHFVSVESVKAKTSDVFTYLSSSVEKAYRAVFGNVLAILCVWFRDRYDFCLLPYLREDSIF
jgi:histone-lysine N-methyltransferase SETMAR